MNRTGATTATRRTRVGGHDDVARVLIAEDRIARRVRQLARQIERDFAGRELVIVALLNGTVVFLADLIRHLSLPLRLDFIGVSSYGEGTRPGALTITKELGLNLRGRDVLVLDDILDSGRTLRHALNRIRSLRPRRVRVCVLLEKRARRKVPIRADYIGFRIPNYFVVGYGLDFAERYRNLPFVGVLRAECCAESYRRLLTQGPTTQPQRFSRNSPPRPKEAKTRGPDGDIGTPAARQLALTKR